MKKIFTVLSFALLALPAQAQLTGKKIYIDPGHGSYGSNDRPAATISYPMLSSTGRPQTGVGFYESNTNLWKCEKLEEMLKAAGAKTSMSHRACGGTTDGTSYNPSLSSRRTEAMNWGADYFISVHSNASSSVKTNFLYLALSGHSGVSSSLTTLQRATAVTAWPYIFESMGEGSHGYVYEPISHYSYTNMKIEKQSLGVMRHSIRGFLSEGYFHTYQPSRHRALNKDWCRQEGLRYYRGIAAYYGVKGTAADKNGYIMGVLKRSDKKMVQSETLKAGQFWYRDGSHDQFYPCNGGTVYLYNTAKQLVAKYNVDNNWNGVFVFENLTPGTYYIGAKAAGCGNVPETYRTVTVKANATSYPIVLVAAGTFSETTESEYGNINDTPIGGTGGSTGGGTTTPTEQTKGIYAYGLKVSGTETYTFEFKVNTTPTAAALVFYKNGTEAGRKEVASPKAGANTVVLHNYDLPGNVGDELTWGVEVKGDAVTSWTQLYEETGKTYTRAFNTVDNNPESSYFGRIYVADRTGASTSSNGFYAYNQAWELYSTSPYKGGETTAWGNPTRPAVAPDGSLFVADWADRHSGVWVAAPGNVSGVYTRFFLGTANSAGAYDNKGVFTGSGTPGVHIYGKGADTKLIVYNEDAYGTLPKNGLAIYNIGNADGSIKTTWGEAPSQVIELTEQGNTEGNVWATSHGIFVSQNNDKIPNADGTVTNVNKAGRASLMFYDWNGTKQFSSTEDSFTRQSDGASKTFLSNLTGTKGGGFAVSADESLLIINDGSNNFMVFSITWNGNKPAFTLLEEYKHGLSDIRQMNFDYAGNLIASGEAGFYIYANKYTSKSTNTTPAKKAMTVKKGEKADPVKGIYAYALKLTKGEDNYTFTFKANDLPESAALIFYHADGTEAGNHAIASPVKGENTVTLAAKDLPGTNGEVLTWGVRLDGKAITAWDRLYTETGVTYSRAFNTVDNSPESNYFGRIYVMDRVGADNAKNGVHAYRQTWERITSPVPPYQPSTSTTWRNPTRMTVAPDGTLFAADWGDAHAGIWMAQPGAVSGTYTQFFAGTKDGDGIYTNNGVVTGSCVTGAHIYGTGADMKLIVYNEDAAGTLKANGIAIYNIGNADGTFTTSWTTAPSKSFDIGDASLVEPPGNVWGTSHGFFVSLNHETTTYASTDAASLRFYDYDGNQLYTSGTTSNVISGSKGGGYAVSRDEKTLIMNDAAGNFIVFDITWSGNTPTLTKRTTFNHGMTEHIRQMNFDYAGNLIVSGEAGFYIYSVPTNDNSTTTPAKKTLTVTVVKETETIEPEKPTAGTITFTHLWTKLQAESGYLGAGNQNRSMAYYDGKLYISTTSSYRRIDAATGALMDEPSLSNSSFLHHNIRITPDGKMLWGNTNMGAAEATATLTVAGLNAGGTGTTSLGSTLMGGRTDFFYTYGNWNESGYLLAMINATESEEEDVDIKYVKIPFAGGALQADKAVMMHSTMLPASYASAKAIPADENTFFASGVGVAPTIHSLETGALLDDWGAEKPQQDADAHTSGMAMFMLHEHAYMVTPLNRYGKFEIYDITQGLSKATKVTEVGTIAEISRANANSLATVDIATHVDGDDAYIYVLAPNNGISAYKFTFTTDVNLGVSTEEVTLWGDKDVTKETDYVDITVTAGGLSADIVIASTNAGVTFETLEGWNARTGGTLRIKLDKTKAAGNYTGAITITSGDLTQTITVAASLSQVTFGGAAIYAANLSLTEADGGYKLTFTSNENANKADLVLYAAGTTIQAIEAGSATEIDRIELSQLDNGRLPVKGENEYLIPATAFPASASGVTYAWAVELGSKPITADNDWATLYTTEGKDMTYNIAYNTVDIYPESPYFGQIYVMDRQSTDNTEGGIYIYSHDNTPQNTAPHKGGTHYIRYPQRLGIDRNGRVYMSDWKTAHPGVFYFDPSDGTKTFKQFFTGSLGSSLITNGTTVVGASTTAATVYGEGANTKLFTFSEVASGTTGTGSFTTYDILIYNIGNEDGTIQSAWGELPSQVIADSYLINPNASIFPTEKGIWIAQARSSNGYGEGYTSASILFFGWDGTRKYASHQESAITGTDPVAIALSHDGKTLVVNNANTKLTVFNISYASDNTPTLTKREDITFSGGNTWQMNFDYAGNLITSGTYGMRIYSFLKENNTCITPARTAVTIAGTYDKVFTTAGDWSVADNWTPAGVPTLEDNVLIQAACTVTANNAVAKSVDLYKNGETKGTLTIAPAAALPVEGPVRRVETIKHTPERIEHDDADLLIQADEDNGQGIFAHKDVTGNTPATVQINGHYTDLRDTHVKWHYVAMPSEQADVMPTFYLSYLVEFDEPNNGWQYLGEGDALDIFKGYLLLQSEAKTYNLKGKLAPVTRTTLSLSKMGTTDAKGENLLGNSWTAPLRISGLTAEHFTDADATIHLWQYQDGSVGSYGAYQTHSVSTAGDIVINPLQAFFVVADKDGATITLDPVNLISATGEHGALNPYKAPQRATAMYEEMGIRVTGNDKYYCDLRLLQNEEYTAGFDNGYDGRKLEGDAPIPYLAGVSTDGDMAVLATPQYDGTFLNFRKGSNGEQYTFTFTYDGTTEYYLEDMHTGTQTAIRADETYTFTPSDDDSYRFRVVAVQKAPDQTTDVPTVWASGDKLYLTNPAGVETTITIYSASGQLVGSIVTTDSVQALKTPTTGVYVIHITSELGSTMVKHVM